MFDFAIIGGGIAGVSAGARLAGHGRVCLLEAETALAYHASGRSAAMFEETYGAASTIALNRASKAYLMSAHGGVLSPRGLMLVGETGQEDAFSADLERMGMARIATEQAVDLVPILNPETVTGAGYREDCWDIDTDRLVHDFARDIRAAGGEVLTGRRVDHIEPRAGSWIIAAGQHSVEARTIVNAAGAWADRVAAMSGVAPLGLQPNRRSMARIPAPGGLDVSSWPMMFGAGERWYAKPDAGSLIVSPADEDPTEPHDAWADDMVLAEGLARYENAVTVPVTRLETSWAGLRTFSPDRCLVIGPDPERRDFFWCAGQGGYGFQSAPAASRFLADCVTGRSPELDPEIAASLLPARFR